MVGSERDTQAGGGRALAFGLGIAAGVALGAGVVLLVAPSVRKALRDDLADRAQRLRDATAEQRQHVGDAVATCVDRARDLAERVRAAGAEGLRDTLAEWAAPADPRRSDLAGVDGMAGAADES